MSNLVGAMYLGFMVEGGAPEGLCSGPGHPKTEMLIASNPVPDPWRRPPGAGFGRQSIGKSIRPALRTCRPEVRS